MRLVDGRDAFAWSIAQYRFQGWNRLIKRDVGPADTFYRSIGTTAAESINKPVNSAEIRTLNKTWPRIGLSPTWVLVTNEGGNGIAIARASQT